MSGFNLNRVTLIGRLTRDPELRSLPSGDQVCSLRIAVNSARRDESAEGGWAERPNYFDVSVFGVAAEHVGRYTQRGSRVAVDGRLEWREWETAEQRRQAVSIVANLVQFLDTAADSPGGGDGAADAASPDLDFAAVGSDAEDDF